jgi:PAS domain S-box-containing protein
VTGVTVNHKNCTIEHLYAVLNSTYNGIVAVDDKGIITLFNNGAENILGISSKEALGQRIDELFNDPSLLTTVETGLLDVGRKVTINGRSVYSNRSPIMKDGKIMGAVAIFQDTTDVENLTKELADAKDSVEILETILDNAYDSIVVVDKDGMITKFNKAYQNFLGVAEEDAIGKHVTDVIENTRMHIVVKTGKPEIGELQKIQGNDMVVMRIPIYKEGKVVGAVGKVLFRDLQEIKALANKLDVTLSELKYYKKELRRLKGSRYTFKNIIGDSEKIKQVKELARLASAGNSNVLIRGESGTGKELFAHAIHDSSLRRYGAFIRVNCAAIPANLLEAELFGYEGGAFTGAKKEGKPGKFELAQSGTIFLDEIGDMPAEMQVKLLRVLQEKEVERIGGDKVIRLDVRIIAATNRNLEEMIEKGEFRQDLYYRLNVLKVEIPPLRELKEDIALLSEKILIELNEELGTSIQGIDGDVIGILRSHNWPGNIRELKNVLERAVNLCKSNKIQKKHLPIYLLDQAEAEKKAREILELQDGEIYSLEGVLAGAEKLAIERALKKTNNNRKKAAELLGIHRSGLYQKMARYNLS